MEFKEFKKYALLDDGTIEPLYYGNGEPRMVDYDYINGGFVLYHDVMLGNAIATKKSRIVKQADTEEELKGERTMKAVMISIQPKWVEKILNGEKTIEVRKTAPKIETPFKVYIYCTKPKSRFRCGAMCFYDDELYRDIKGNIKYGSSIELMACSPESYSKDNFLNGTVVGEFVCDRIIELEGEFWDDETYESIGEVWYDEDDGERNVSIFVDNGCDDYKDNKLCKESCVPWEELRRYIGTGIKTFYALHISDLKVYDQPKEIGEFKNLKGEPIKRPFQSWGYVEE